MNNKIMFLWAFIVVGLLSVLLILGYSKRDKVYIELENKIEKATLSYLTDNNLIPKTEETELVFISELLEKEYLKDEVENIDKYCIESISFTKGLVKDRYVMNKNCKDKE
ncbi:MAG: hypothetical protein IKR57_04105 [Bacilli bacterium]|nr:hypothetical protein [Bacilli bacterium]